MNRAKKTLFLLLLSFAVAPSLFSKNINIEEISAEFDSIQLGAFKERKIFYTKINAFLITIPS